jgi:uncharacterized Tic20 family protein
MAETNQTPQSAEGPDSGEQTGEAAAPKQPVSTAELEEIEQPETSKEARNMAMLCHLLGIIGFFAPLVIWLIEKDKHRFVREHGRAAMNYQVSLMIYYFASGALCIVFIGFVLLPVLTILHIVFSIIGAVKASKGKPWRYPIAIPFLK